MKIPALDPTKSLHEVVSTACPICQTVLDAAAGNVDDPGPTENDLSVCLYCGGYLVFNKDLTIRALNPSELELLTEEERWVLTHMRAVVKSVNSHRRN